MRAWINARRSRVKLVRGMEEIYARSSLASLTIKECDI